MPDNVPPPSEGGPPPLPPAGSGPEAPPPPVPPAAEPPAEPPLKPAIRRAPPGKVLVMLSSTSKLVPPGAAPAGEPGKTPPPLPTPRVEGKGTLPPIVRAAGGLRLPSFGKLIPKQAPRVTMVSSTRLQPPPSLPPAATPPVPAPVPLPPAAPAPPPAPASAAAAPAAPPAPVPEPAVPAAPPAENQPPAEIAGAKPAEAPSADRPPLPEAETRKTEEPVAPPPVPASAPEGAKEGRVPRFLSRKQLPANKGALPPWKRGAEAKPEPPPAEEAAAPAAPAKDGKKPRKFSPLRLGRKPAAAAPDAPASVPAPASRAARQRRRRIIGTVIFYVFLAVALPVVYWVAYTCTQETRLEGQAIPPAGATLAGEALIVSDFREQAAGIADDLARERAPKLQEIQERQEHVRRAQADVTVREDRIHLLLSEIQSTKDEVRDAIKQAHDAAQAVWDGPGAELDHSYNAKLDDLQRTIAARARSLKLAYQPDDSYHSPEVWANAYRLALYEVPPGVDGVKEHQWIEDQMKQWRDFTKSVDDRQKTLRDQAAAAQQAPSAKIADDTAKIDDLQRQIESTQAEEAPLKVELQQAQADLAQSQATESALDGRYYRQLDSVAEGGVIDNIRLPIAPNGRFSWRHLERGSIFTPSEPSHPFWIFIAAVRPDGRKYWALHRCTIARGNTVEMIVEPSGFISTRSVLRPDLPPEDAAQ